MADTARLTLEGVEQARDTVIRDVLGAGTQAVREATRALEKAFEEATKSAVPGRLWRAWASRTFPKRGIARNPAGEVFVNGDARSRGAIAFFTQPGAIKGKAGQFLAIPTAAAGPRGRARNLTPGEWERAHGVRLRFVYRPGRSSLLVLDQGQLSGKAGIGVPNTPGRRRQGRQDATIVVFILLPLVKHRNSIRLGPMVRRAEADLIAAANRLLAQLNKR